MDASEQFIEGLRNMGIDIITGAIIGLIFAAVIFILWFLLQNKGQTHSR